MDRLQHQGENNQRAMINFGSNYQLEHNTKKHCFIQAEDGILHSHRREHLKSYKKNQLNPSEQFK
jgi:hypothetical protein